MPNNKHYVLNLCGEDLEKHILEQMDDEADIENSTGVKITSCGSHHSMVALLLALRRDIRWQWKISFWVMSALGSICLATVALGIHAIYSAGSWHSRLGGVEQECVKLERRIDRHHPVFGEHPVYEDDFLGELRKGSENDR